MSKTWKPPSKNLTGYIISILESKHVPIYYFNVTLFPASTQVHILESNNVPIYDGQVTLL